MSDARWCDLGDHAYKAGRPGTLMLGKVEEVPNQWGGSQPHTQSNIKEVCPECAAAMGLNDDYEAPESPAVRHSRIAKEIAKG